MDMATVINKILFNGKDGRMNESAKAAIQKAFDLVLKRQSENSTRLPGFDGMKTRLRVLRESSLGDKRLFETAVENMRKNGFKVIETDGIDEAFEAVLREINGERLVVKSKSNISKEMHLRDRLKEKGIDAVETDIGDRIIQFSGDSPSHPTGPATHLTAEKIAEIVSTALGKDIPPIPERLVEELRDDIKKAIAASKVGITGANAVCAEEGSIVIIHNEGNVSEVSRLPGKHIILADSHKICRNLEEAALLTKLQTYCATGAITTSYMNVISGISKTADIEKKLFYGIHGPKEAVVILIKRKPLPSEFKESEFCIGCGGCILECPVYLEKGSAFGTHYKQGGIGVISSSLRKGLEEGIKEGLFSCTTCGACVTNCPVRIDTPAIIKGLRSRAGKSEDPNVKRRLRPYRIIARSIIAMASAMKTLSLVKRTFFRENNSDIAYFPGCIATLNTPRIKSSVIKLMEKMTGKRPRVIEGCCGGAWESFGYEKNCGQTLDKLLAKLSRNPLKTIVVTCPHCYDILWLQNRDKLASAGIGEVKTLTQFVMESGKKSMFTADSPFGGQDVFYHDSCIFGRKMGVFDEPREILKNIAGVTLLKADKEREKSRCCGFPALANEPETAFAMAKKVVDSAMEAGAKKLVTSGCPGCHYALKRSGGIEVVDITEILCETINNDKSKERKTYEDKAGHNNDGIQA
ncbi:MAG: LUD domain-containing protein [Thermodesulfobacteriota bacterium]